MIFLRDCNINCNDGSYFLAIYMFYLFIIYLPLLEYKYRDFYLLCPLYLSRIVALCSGCIVANEVYPRLDYC